MVGIIDYGVGNLFSLQSSFAAIGEACVVSGDPAVMRGCDRLILPGVGAFEDAARKLRESGLYELVLEEARAGKPLMGICLGMQLLFDRSFEYGEHRGLGFIPGDVAPIADFIGPDLKIPHIGWNSLQFRNESCIFKGVENGSHVYFVHSYHACRCEAYTTAVTDYGGTLTASVERGNVLGCQFHPEKSGSVGLRILKNFANL